MGRRYAVEVGVGPRCARVARDVTATLNAPLPRLPEVETLAPCSARTIAALILSTAFSPMRGSFRIEPSAKTRLRSSTVWTPAFFQRRAAVLGPSPGISITATRPGGALARSSSSSAMRPELTNSTILSAILGPTPSISMSFCRASAACATGPRS